MRVCIVNYAYDPEAGSPATLLDRYPSLTGWSEALLTAGAATVTVVQRFSTTAHLARAGVQYHFIADGAPPVLPVWRCAVRAGRAARNERADVVHVNGLHFPAAIRSLRGILPRDRPLLVQDHASRVPRSACARTAWRLGLRGADGFLFAARALADPWRGARVIAIRQPVYEVMEAGTSLPNPFEPRPSEADRLPGEPAMLWVGRLNRNKDPLTVLEGFRLALRSLPRAALTLVFHEASLLPEVRGFLQGRPDVAGRVHVLGQVSRKTLMAMYAGADLFVLGSHHEGSGFALIEALASSVVPVVTDIPTFRVLTRNGALGALWAPGDARAFAAALGKVGARDLRPLRAAISSHVRNELAWGQIGCRAIDVYRSALSTAGGGHTTAVA